MKKVKSIVIAGSALLLSACAYQPQQYDAGLTVPVSFSRTESAKVNHEIEKSWWLTFKTKELDRLLAEMEASNNDVVIAQHRLQKSLALLGVQRADNWPQVSGNVLARHDENHASNQHSDSETLTLQASYAIDLWGLRDAQNSSALYQYQFQQQQLSNTLLSLRALLSLQYFNAISLQERVAITQHNLEATAQLYQRIELKYELGQSSRIELDQQRNVLLNQKKLLKQLELDREVALRGVAVLLGRDHFDGLTLAANINDIHIPDVELVQPARLLETRPDIRMAELNLRISDAELFAAKAKRWPSLTLSAEAGVRDVFDKGDVTTSLLGGLVAPIFQGGRITRQIDAAEVETNVQLTSYRKTVINAMQQALDALTAYEYQQSIYQLQNDSVGNNESLYQQAKLQYQLGATDFLNLLEAQRSLFEARDAMVRQKLIYLSNIINVYKAMGGSEPDYGQQAIFISSAGS